MRKFAEAYEDPKPLASCSGCEHYWHYTEITEKWITQGKQRNNYIVRVGMQCVHFCGNYL